MKSPKDVEKEFFEKIKVKKVDKISLNISTESLTKLDELANIFGITRTTVIESILIMGIPEYIRVYEEADKKVRKNEEYKDKISILNGRLQKIQEFKKKWKIK